MSIRIYLTELIKTWLMYDVNIENMLRLWYHLPVSSAPTFLLPKEETFLGNDDLVKNYCTKKVLNWPKVIILALRDDCTSHIYF